MKRILLLLSFFCLTFFIETKAQELEAKWGKSSKFKKGRHAIYDFVGSTENAVFLINYKKEKIFLNKLNKTSLQLTKTVSLKVNTILWEKKKYPVKYYKAFIENNQVYLFVYIEPYENKGKIFLLGAKFNLQGKKLSAWKNISETYKKKSFIAKEKPRTFLERASGNNYKAKPKNYELLLNKITYNKALNLFTLNKSKLPSRSFGEFLFFDTSFNVIEFNKQSDSETERVFFSENGRVWLVRNTDKCDYVSEVKHSSLEGYYRTSEKCISISEASSKSNNLKMETSMCLIGEEQLQILSLVRSGGEYSEMRARILDMEEGIEIVNYKYSFTTKELDEFRERAKSLLREDDEEKMKNQGGTAFATYDKKKVIFQPSYIYDDLPFFSAEVRNRSYYSHYKSGSGGNPGKYISGSTNNYGNIFTFYYDTITEKIIHKWIYKKQSGHYNKNADMLLSFIPLTIKGTKYFIFTDNEEGFTKGEAERFTVGVSNSTRFGYYMINENNDVSANVLTKVWKETRGSSPRMNIHYFDGENIFLLAGKLFGSKMRLVKLSLKN